MATTNTLYALFAASDPQKLFERLSGDQVTAAGKAVPIRSYKTAESSWLIVAPNTITTTELSGALGITDGSVSTGILVRAENYFGRANKDVWEWLDARMGETLDAANK